MTEQERRRADIAAAADRRLAAIAAGTGPGYDVDDAPLASLVKSSRISKTKAALKKKPVKHEDPDSSDGSDFAVPATPSAASSDGGSVAAGKDSDGEENASVLTTMQKEYNRLVEQSKKMMTIELRRKMARLTKKITDLEQKGVRDKQAELKKAIQKREGKARKLTQGEKNKM